MSNYFITCLCHVMILSFVPATNYAFYVGAPQTHQGTLVRVCCCSELCPKTSFFSSNTADCLIAPLLYVKIKGDLMRLMWKI